MYIVSMNKVIAILMTEDKSMSLTIEFWGYTLEDAEAYITKAFIECDKPYAEKWTQMKWL